MDFVRCSVPSNKTTGYCRYIFDELIQRYPDSIRFHQNGADLVPRHFGRREKRVSARCSIEVAKRSDASHAFAVVVAVAEPYFAVLDLIRPDDLLPLVTVWRDRIDPCVFGPKPVVFFGDALRQRVEFRPPSAQRLDDPV